MGQVNIITNPGEGVHDASFELSGGSSAEIPPFFMGLKRIDCLDRTGLQYPQLHHIMFVIANDNEVLIPLAA